MDREYPHNAHTVFTSCKLCVTSNNIYIFIYLFIYVLLAVHLSIILVINQPIAQILFFIISLLYSSTYFEHYVLIIRRSKLYYTASGIITPVGGRRVHRLREDCSPAQILVL